MLRQWASPEPGGIPQRQFRTTAILDGERDLGAQAKQIAPQAAALVNLTSTTSGAL